MSIRDAIATAHAKHYHHIGRLLHDVVAEQHGESHLLTTMCDYHLGTGGKRLRALLPCLVAEAMGHSAREVYAMGAACEMLHNATLVHDDLQDGDDTRRGHPTVWARFSEAQAINLGDGMYFYALLCLDKLPGDAELRWQIARRFMVSTARVVDGQVREFALKDVADPAPAEYLTMVEHKTSALFALPMAGTAQLIRAPAGVVEALEAAATHLGIVFQLQDDLLDLYGDKGRTERGSDISEGKISALVVHALELAPPEEARQLRTILSLPRDETTGEQVAWAIECITRCGARQAALDEIRRREALVAAFPEWRQFADLGRLVTGLTDAFVAPIAHLFETSEVDS